MAMAQGKCSKIYFGVAILDLTPLTFKEKKMAP